ncbi:MAG TPA: tripartite tricarboxylate transporter substrate-binding protein [Alphaproteobacteria bacterium]|jgi:tripartite-type tricarboxylate transporter receptor subunit TctC|nr:tripartite tricarboxylate transporter substrate-binding protein [Alphaproteobacteria bacterium]
MTNGWRHLGRHALVCAAFGLLALPAAADDFYKGKQIKLIVGSGTGGGYDANARLLARYLPDHIPGKPEIVVQNLAGAGSLKAMNYIANAAPKDGLNIGAVQNSIGYEPMMGISGGKENAQFDVLKMNWLGSMTKEVAVTVMMNTAGIKTFHDLQEKEVTTGSSGAATSNTIYARLMNATAGTKFNVIHGYVGQTEVFLAMERGEVQGSAGPFYGTLKSGRAEWLKNGTIIPIVQIALEKHPELPNIPLILDFAKTAEDRQEMELAVASLLMGRPYVVADNVPADRVKILQDSFMAAVRDPALLTEAKKQNLEIDPIDGKRVHDLLAKMYATPQPIIDKVTAIFVPEKK